jgi:hypothetical protein
MQNDKRMKIFLLSISLTLELEANLLDFLFGCTTKFFQSSSIFFYENLFFDNLNKAFIIDLFVSV